MTTVEQYGLVGGPVYDNGIGQQGQTFASYNAEVSAQTAVSSAPRQRQGSGFACKYWAHRASCVTFLLTQRSCAAAGTCCR